MSCCCTRIYKLCDLILCDGEDLVLPIEIPADGEYMLELEFMGSVVQKFADQTMGDNATFDKDELNEQFTYTGQVKNEDGETITFEIEGKTYDCIEFTTKKKVDDEGYTASSSSSGPRKDIEGSLNYIIDGGATEISLGVKPFIEWGFDAIVRGWTVLADQVGNIVVDVWKDNYGNFAPTVADTIAGTEKPTIVAAQKNQDMSLTSFSTVVLKGDIWAFNVESVTDIKRVTISFRFNKQ